MVQRLRMTDNASQASFLRVAGILLGGFALAIVQRNSREKADRSMKVVGSALLLEQAGD